MVVQCRVAASRRSKISASPRTSSCAVGSSSSTTPAPSVDGRQRPGQRDALPLAARQVGAAVVAAGQHRVERGQIRRSRRFERGAHDVVRRAGRGHVVAQRQLEADEVLEHGGDARAPRREIELAKVDAVDLDRARLRIVQAAQQLGERRLAGAVLSDDGERRAGGNGEIEVLQHRRAAPG